MQRILATLVICLLTAPAALALSGDLAFPQTHLPPGLEGPSADLTVTVDCQEVFERSPPLATNSVDVTISTEPPPSFTIAGPSTIEVDTEPCIADPQGSVQSEATPYTFSANRDALGLVSQTAMLTLSLEGGEFGAEPLNHTVTGPITAGYFGAASMQVESSNVVLTEDNPVAEIVVQVTNFGNAPTVAHFSLNEPLGEAVNVQLPENLLLGSANRGEENTGTAIVRISLDEESLENDIETETLELQMSISAADDASLEGPPSTARIALHLVSGKATPAPTFLLAAPTLLAAALLARRRA